jgi:hypothetical protein
VVLASLSSCDNITQSKVGSTRSPSSSTIPGGALIYEANPVVLSGNTNLTQVSYGRSLTSRAITDNLYLTKKCDFSENGSTYTTLNNCIEVKNDRGVANSGLIQKNGDSWTFATGSDEFYQVNAFYHVNKVQEIFTEALEFTRDTVHQGQMVANLPPSIPYQPGLNRNFWLYSNVDPNATLQIYSRCYIDQLNAFFDPSKNEVCLGWNPTEDANTRMVQDPSIIYHEMGHAFVKIMMNSRNQYTSGFTLVKTPFESELGSLNYDEAGAINEGVADFFSYLVNGRDSLFEWAAKSQARPMSEDNYLHAGRIPSNLRYPEFLHYAADQPTNAIEDIHNSGQIVSHYLYRLQESFKNQCSNLSGMTADQKHAFASKMSILLLAESLGEIGDMTARGSDFLNPNTGFLSSPAANLTNIFFTNLNPDEAFLWTQQVEPANFRRFFRIFAKNIKNYISGYLCPEFTDDESEKLLDDYGLLLFKYYGIEGKGIDQNNLPNPLINYQSVSVNGFGGSTSINGVNQFSNSGLSAAVNEGNRINSVLISKTLIDLPTDDRATATISDSRANIQSFLNQLTFEGSPVNLSEGLAGPEYNNDNVRISPGEVVGVALNLVNNSNSTMAGIQILANDWDHMKLKDSAKSYVNRSDNLTDHAGEIARWEPCQIGGWPLDTEGGVVYSPETNYASQTLGSCDYPTRTNKIFDEASLLLATPQPKYDQDAPQPICMVQLRDDNETKWVSQDEFREDIGLSDSECLNSSQTGGGVSLDFNPNECLIRVLPGANQATLGKIDPGKTWAETMIATTSDSTAKFGANAFVMMEVNKWIPPGTKFNCRFRTKFSNCQDCYNDNNSSKDFLSFDFAGERPFKVINFAFEVVD